MIVNRIFAILSMVLIVLTAGCGFTIHYGGKTFANAIKGHMILGVLSILAVIALGVSVFIGKRA